MPLTEGMLRNRRDRIGASEIAGLMGETPYHSPQSIFDRLVLGITKEPNEAMALGNWFEPEIARYARRRRGMVMRANWRSYLHKTLPIAAHPDYLVNPYAGKPRGFGEVKLSGRFVAFEGSNIPRTWYWQCQTQAALGPRDGVWLIELNGSQLITEWIPRDREAWQRAEETVRAFVKDHLETGWRPEPEPWELVAPSQTQKEASE